MNTNLTNANFSTADQEAIATAIATIKQKLPFLIDLTRNDRQALVKLGDKSQAFLKKALDVAAQNPGVLPVSFDLNGMRNNANLCDDLSSISLALRQLHRQVEDTAMHIGSQAYAAARTVYACAKSGFAGAALQAVAGELGKRFGRRSPSGASVAAETTSSPPTTSTPGA